MKSLKLSIKLIILALLFGCKPSILTYDYLMQHPSVLQDEYKRCERVADDKQCEVVRQAAQDFLRLVNERNEDPEAFGQKVIQIQIDLVALASHPEMAEAYHQKKQKLKNLYAVIAATTSE